MFLGFISHQDLPHLPVSIAGITVLARFPSHPEDRSDESVSSFLVKSGMRLPGQDGATRKTPSRLLGSNPAPLQSA
jgi:hypothetical protein